MLADFEDKMYKQKVLSTLWGKEGIACTEKEWKLMNFDRGLRTRKQNSDAKRLHAHAALHTTINLHIFPLVLCLIMCMKHTIPSIVLNAFVLLRANRDQLGFVIADLITYML